MADNRQFVFGPGVIWCELASFLDTGAAPTIAIPTRFDVSQSLSLDFSLNPKELYGQQTFPAAIGIGQGKLTGKVIGGRINSQLLQNAFYGASNALTPATGKRMAIDEAHSVPATPFQVTVTHSATWTRDWGVRDATTGSYLTPVVSGPITGQYSVAAGVYTFAAADTGRAVLFDYDYTNTTDVQFELDSFLQGLITLFGLRYQGTFNFKPVGVWIPNAVGNKFTFNSKQQDFIMPEFDFTAFASPNGQVAQMWLTE